MASRYELEITIVSAKDLKNVNWLHGSLKPYAVVWVDPAAKSTTRVDEEGDTSPYWDQKLIIPFNSPIEDSTLYIDIVNAKPGEGTKALIGSAKLHLRDAVDNVGFGSRLDKKIELKRPSGRPHGKLEIIVTVRDARYRSQESYYAPPYGVPPHRSRDYPPANYGRPYDAPPSYAPPPSGYSTGYGAPAPAYAQPSYGHSGYYSQTPPPPQGGYYGQQPVYEEKKKSNFGGMGAGLAVGAVAGALGGLALAEGFDKLEDHVADEAAERVEEDYGGDDYGGGDDY